MPADLCVVHRYGYPLDPTTQRLPDAHVRFLLIRPQIEHACQDLTTGQRAPRGDCEVEKIFAERGSFTPSIAVAPEESAELFPRPEHLAAPRSPPAVVGGRQVEQLEAAVHGCVTTIGAAGLVRPDRAVHFAPNVRELLDQGQRFPPARGKAGVPPGRCCHYFTRPFTIRRMVSRNPASSTPRERFPRDGRMLIIESYSIQSSSLVPG